METKGENKEGEIQLFRQKRKWQIALRRYILEGQACTAYAPYFGLDNKSFRKWIEVQFDSETSWDSFSQNWQLDHVIPVNYFDFNDKGDMSLCWNFTNIRMDKIKTVKDGPDVLSAKAHFQRLYNHTGYSLCLDMVKKIESIELSQAQNTNQLERFINEQREYIDTIAGFNSYEFSQLNEGIQPADILNERKLLQKFGDVS